MDDQSKAPSQTSKPTDIPAIDLTHLRRSTYGDKALEHEILTLFLQQLPELLTGLEVAGNERDWQYAAHAIKGSGRLVGAWSLAALAEQAETQRDFADVASRRNLCTQINAEAGIVRDCVHASIGPA